MNLRVMLMMLGILVRLEEADHLLRDRESEVAALRDKNDIRAQAQVEERFALRKHAHEEWHSKELSFVNSIKNSEEEIAKELAASEKGGTEEDDEPVVRKVA
ncbi:hypothetical protein ACJX0J_011264 [Zea mays]